MKEFARSIPAGQRRRDATLVQDVRDTRQAAVPDRLAEREQVDNLLSRLPERQRTLVRAHYGLADEHGLPPASLEDLGRDWNMTPRRLRQMERNALSRLRQGNGTD
jgi:DNA-directed RNA polymerase sigma subunit (sigma70/sigma32)